MHRLAYNPRTTSRQQGRKHPRVQAESGTSKTPRCYATRPGPTYLLSSLIMIREIKLHRLSSQGWRNGLIEQREVSMIIGATPHTDISKTGRNAAIYLRTSTKEQNPANQLNDCIAFCNKISISEYEVFSEQKSAWRREKNREVFDTLAKNLEHKKYDVLVVW